MFTHKASDAEVALDEFLHQPPSSSSVDSILTKKAVMRQPSSFVLPEFVVLCAVFKPHSAEFFFQLRAVDIEVGAKLVERRIAVAQVHVYGAVEHHWVTREFHRA